MTPGLIDAILVVVALEAVFLGGFLVHASAPHLIPPLCLYLASGASILLALRAALSAAAPHWIELSLLASLVTHAASLWVLYRVLQRASPFGLQRGEQAG
jgi:hypothetical protein